MGQAIEHHRRKVRFFSTIELVNALEQEKAKGKAGQIAETLVRLDLLILDELGYLPFSASGRALLFHLLSKLYERTSVIITTKDLSLAQKHTFQFARTFMVLVTFFRFGDEFGVLPSAELEDDEVEILAEYNPFEYGPAH